MDGAEYGKGGSVGVGVRLVGCGKAVECVARLCLLVRYRGREDCTTGWLCSPQLRSSSKHAAAAQQPRRHGRDGHGSSLHKQLLRSANALLPTAAVAASYTSSVTAESAAWSTLSTKPASALSNAKDVGCPTSSVVFGSSLQHPTSPHAQCCAHYAPQSPSRPASISPHTHPRVTQALPTACPPPVYRLQWSSRCLCLGTRPLCMPGFKPPTPSACQRRSSTPRAACWASRRSGTA